MDFSLAILLSRREISPRMLYLGDDGIVHDFVPNSEELTESEILQPSSENNLLLESLARIVAKLHSIPLSDITPSKVVRISYLLFCVLVRRPRTHHQFSVCVCVCVCVCV